MTNYEYRQHVREQRDTFWLWRLDMKNTTSDIPFLSEKQKRIIWGELHKRQDELNAILKTINEGYFQ